jgi:ribonuclease T2
LKRLVHCALLAVLATAPAGAEDGREVRGGPAGHFDFYVLALSWSPGFCATDGGRKARGQCEPGRGLGFTVHGLWPQFERGFPTECEPSPRAPSRQAIGEAENLYPDEGLARYQWRKHGTCAGTSPADYFRDVRRAREQVAIPDRFRSPPRDAQLAPLDIERAFAAANPGLRPDMMSVVCRRGLLQEVRICFDKDLRGFRRCPAVDSSGCRFGDIRINAPR